MSPLRNWIYLLITLPLVLTAESPPAKTIRIIAPTHPVKTTRAASIAYYQHPSRPNLSPHTRQQSLPIHPPHLHPQHHKLPITKPHTIYIHQNAAPSNQPQYSFKIVPEHLADAIHIRPPPKGNPQHSHPHPHLIKYHLVQDAAKYQTPDDTRTKQEQIYKHQEALKLQQYQEELAKYQQAKGNDQNQDTKEVTKIIPSIIAVSKENSESEPSKFDQELLKYQELVKQQEIAKQQEILRQELTKQEYQVDLGKPNIYQQELAKLLASYQNQEKQKHLVLKHKEIPIEPSPQPSYNQEITKEQEAYLRELSKQAYQQELAKQQEDLVKQQTYQQQHLAKHQELAKQQAYEAEVSKQQAQAYHQELAKQQEMAKQQAYHQELAKQQEIAKQQAYQQELAKQQEIAKQQAYQQELAKQRELAKQQAYHQELAKQQEIAKQQAYHQELAKQQEIAKQQAYHQELAKQQEIAKQQAYQQEVAKQRAYQQEIAKQQAFQQALAKQQAYEAQLAKQQEIAKQQAYEQELAKQKEIAKQQAYHQELAKQRAYEAEIAKQQAYQQELAKQKELAKQQEYEAKQKAYQQELAKQEEINQEEHSYETELQIYQKELAKQQEQEAAKEQAYAKQQELAKQQAYEDQLTKQAYEQALAKQQAYERELTKQRQNGEGGVKHYQDLTKQLAIEQAEIEKQEAIQRDIVKQREFLKKQKYLKDLHFQKINPKKESHESYTHEEAKNTQTIVNQQAIPDNHRDEVFAYEEEGDYQYQEPKARQEDYPTQHVITPKANSKVPVFGSPQHSGATSFTDLGKGGGSWAIRHPPVTPRSTAAAAAALIPAYHVAPDTGYQSAAETESSTSRNYRDDTRVTASAGVSPTPTDFTYQDGRTTITVQKAIDLSNSSDVVSPSPTASSSTTTPS